MDYRTGKCSQCGAEYKVPASFAHNAARCKKCQGVVHLGPSPAAAAPRAAGSPSIPAKRVVPKPESARPAAPQAQPGAAPRPAAPKPTAPAPAAAKGGTLERLKSERAAHGEAPAPAKAAAPATAAASARGKEHEAEGHGAKREKRGGRAERGPREKKKAPVVGIVSVAALVVVGAGLVLFRETLFGGGEAGASEGTTAATPAAATPAGGSTQPGAAAPTELAAAPAEAQREPAPEAVTPGGDAPAATQGEKPKAETKAKDPATIDLTAIPDFGPTPDTTPEEWTKMNEQVGVWMDVEAGAAGNRARLELIKQTRKAVPVILNTFKKLDFSTKDGRSNGGHCQKALMQICNGTNFDWKYVDEAAGQVYDNPDDVWFCKRVVELWSNSWKQAEADIKAWIKIAKLEEKDPAEAKRLLEMFGGQSPPDAGSSDDLEVD